MQKTTKLTCTEFAVVTKANSGILKLFKMKVRQESRLPETKDVRTLKEWEKAFNEFKGQ